MRRPRRRPAKCEGWADGHRIQQAALHPADHRGSFEKGLFGWTGALTPAQTAQIAESKRVIYDAFELALARGLPGDRAGILVDAQFGAAILRDARAKGYITCMPAEKSGQAEFELEYGERYAAMIEDFGPTFVKVLVRYNPEDDAARNRRQVGRLRALGDYLHKHGHAFMFELLVPPTLEQTDRLEGDQQLYDHDLRPSLMMAAIKELQDGGVEPDVWKIEGLDRRQDCAKVAEVARRDGRSAVGCIILGRGSNARKVVDWLAAAALVGLRDGKTSRLAAVEAIAARYLEWVAAFEGARAA